MKTTEKYTVLFLDSVKKKMNSIPETDRAKIVAAVTLMEDGNLHLVETKTLRSPVRELKIKKYRLIFFMHGKILYFIHMFIKQTTKTPQKEIKYMEKIYKQIMKT